MKKILSVVLTVFLMLSLLSISTAAATPLADKEWVAPEGIKTYYATNVSGKTPVIDGIINEGEYGDGTRIDEPKATEKSTWGNSWQKEPYDDTLASEYIDLYFAYDEESIYIAFYEKGAPEISADTRKNSIVAKNDYRLCFGFDPWDLGKWHMFEGAASNSNWTELRYYTNASISDKDKSLKTVDLISEFKVRKTDLNTGALVAEGDLTSANGNVSYLKGRWGLTIELKIDRKDAIEIFNASYGTSYDDIADVMYFGLVTTAYRGSDAPQYFKWAGQTDITDNQKLYTDYGIPEKSTRDSILDLVVFEEKVSETTPADDSDYTTIGAIPAKNGCGAAITVAGLTAIIAFTLGTALVIKKKED